MNNTYFVYTIDIGFHDPWTSAWMTGSKKMGADSVEDMESTIARYDAYYKDKYGKCAYCRRREDK